MSDITFVKKRETEKTFDEFNVFRPNVADKFVEEKI